MGDGAGQESVSGGDGDTRGETDCRPRTKPALERIGGEEEADWVENLDPVTKKWYKEKKESEERQVEKAEAEERLRKLRENRARKEKKLAGNRS